MNSVDHPDGADQTRAFTALFSDRAMGDLITDADAQMDCKTYFGQTFPVTITDPSDRMNCYLCSPTTAYIDYGLAEVATLRAPAFAKSLMSAMIKMCRPLVRAAGLDAQVQINNWMVSTNPAPPFERDVVDVIKQTSIADHPTRAIVIRSLNDVWDRGAIATLKAAGFKLLAARQVYLLPTGHNRSSRDAKRDASMLADTSLERLKGQDFTREDFDRCAALYRALYLEKHTSLNPHYTAAFLHHLQASGVMQFVALRHITDGIVGFTAVFERHRTLTQPFVGYDTTRPQHEGLYRMLMHLGRDHAVRHDLNFNLSAGAAGA